MRKAVRPSRRPASSGENEALTEKVLTLADDFAAPAESEWMALVEKTLKGETFEDALVSHTAGGLEIRPLYTAADAAPTARDLRPRDGDRPWDLRTTVANPDPARANADILKDLESGAASVLLKIDPTGVNGVAIGSATTLAGVLDGVLLDLAPVALDAGFLGPKAADWLAAAAKDGPESPLAFQMDPLTAFATAGTSPGPVESHIISAATVGQRLSVRYPKASLMLASGRAVHEAGGTEAQELAFMAAAGLAYAKALVRAGLSLEEAFARITLGVSLDAEYFTGVAKLRAAKAVWARITSASGAQSVARIEVRSSQRMLANMDPWTNLLRLTAAGFAGAVGGADAIVLGCFTDGLGLPTAFARRQARNTQLVLMEESHLGRVADPAGGAWYLDALTDEMARAAWTRFQAIEAAGGVIAALESGHVAAEVDAARKLREAEVADGKAKLLGVTVFRNADAKPVEVETVDPAAFAVTDAPSATLPGPASSCTPLIPVRLAAAFEEA